jgi:hypothetical protein
VRARLRALRHYKCPWPSPANPQRHVRGLAAGGEGRVCVRAGGRACSDGSENGDPPRTASRIRSLNVLMPSDRIPLANGEGAGPSGRSY